MYFLYGQHSVAATWTNPSPWSINYLEAIVEGKSIFYPHKTLQSQSNVVKRFAQYKD